LAEFGPKEFFFATAALAQRSTARQQARGAPRVARLVIAANAPCSLAHFSALQPVRL
jgi:hypothetical protein